MLLQNKSKKNGCKLLNHKILSLMACLLFLSGCGFQPMYGSHTQGNYDQDSVENNLDQVSIANIPDADGQALRNKLIDTLTPSGIPINPRYNLIIAPLNERKVDLDVTIESETTRAQLQISTVLQLQDKNSGEILLKRSLYAASSYNVLGSQFTTNVSKNDTKEAILNDLARQVKTQLSLYFQR